MMYTWCRRSLETSLLVAGCLLLLLPASSIAQGHEDWSYNLGIYEVNVRQYTQEGTFSAFEDHLDRLQDMGVGMLWFMPIHPIGRQNRLGSLGSYYSVRDYLDVNPEFGTLDDFKALVREIHRRGMYVLLDWVPNHTAWDNPLTVEHPEWYATDANGNFMPPPGTNWSDVIQLDHAQQGLRDFMIDAMRFWIEEVGVDGFRFDAVSFVPRNFWEEVLPALREIRPDIFLLAEADGPEWHDVGFDMTHGWGLYGFGSGVLKRIVDGGATAATLRRYAEGEKTRYPADAYRMYFTANHDENSWHGTTRELFGDASDVFAVLTATFNGMPLIYSGQEAGLDKRLAFFDKDLIPWRDHALADLYAALLHLKKENPALWNGERGAPFERVSTTNDVNVFAFIRQKDDDKVLVVLNLSDRQQTVNLTGTSASGTYRGVFTGENIALGEEAEMTLPSWGYAVYEARAVDTGMADDQLPVSLTLNQNHPNPFTTRTTISYSLAKPADVRLALFDTLGREVQVLAAGTRDAGRHEVDLVAKGLPSGVYVYRLQTENFVEAKRLVLLR